MSVQGYILVVDDDQDILEAMRIILESGGYSVTTVVDSQTALQELARQRPDLVILDVMMRYQDEGFQLSYQIKNNSDWSNIPILMITAVSQESGFKFSPEADGDFLPVDDFLEKPIQPKLLLERVAALLNK